MKKLRKDGSEIGSPTSIQASEPSAFNRPSDFLDALIEKKQLRSDYGIAKAYHLSKARVSGYRTGKHGFDDSMSMIIERELELPKGTVATWVRAYQARDAVTKDYWQDIERTLKSLGGIAAALLIGIGGLSAPSPAQASATPKTTSTVGGIGIM